MSNDNEIVKFKSLNDNHKSIAWDMQPHAHKWDNMTHLPDSVNKGRHERVKQVMDKNNLDHLFIGHPANQRYIGHADARAVPDADYSLMYLADKNIDLTMVSLGSAESYPCEDPRFPWIKENIGVCNIADYYAQPEEWSARLAALFNKRGVKRIGLDQISAEVLFKLQKLCPDVEFVGVGKDLFDCHRKLFPEEVVLMEEAARICSGAISYAAKQFTNGMRDIDIAADACWWAHKHGAERVNHYLTFTSGEAPGGNWSSLDYLLRSGRRLNWGDIFVFDFGVVSRGGYWADAGKTVFAGDPGERVKDAWRQYVQIQHELANSIKPGWLASDVYRENWKLLQKPGIFTKQVYSGHGAGLYGRMAPGLAPADHPDYTSNYIDYELEVGMILCVEALTTVKDGRGRDVYFLLEEIAVVEENGLRKLTRHDYPFVSWDDVTF